MKLLLLLTLFCFGASSVLGHKGGFRVRFGVGGYGTKHFVNLPKYSSDALSQGWTQEDRADTDVLPDLTLYCHSSYIICVHYDVTGYASGLQVAIPSDEFKEDVYNWSVQGFVQWKPSNGKSYWAIQQYFVNEEFLATSAESRVANRDANKFLQANGVWVRGNNREILHIGNTTDEVYRAGFTEQACIPLMGVHQYRNMTRDLTCSAETLYPFFTLTDKNNLVATGLVIYGKFEEKDVDWFERPPKVAVQVIVPRGPDCLYELAANPGMVTIHIYYIDRPWTLTCLPFLG